MVAFALAHSVLISSHLSWLSGWYFYHREDIAWTLQTLSPNALELSRLWHESGYIAARLLDVASPELLDRLPVKVEY